MYLAYDLLKACDVAMPHTEEEELNRLKACIDALMHKDEGGRTQDEIAKMQARIVQLAHNLTSMGLVENERGEWWPKDDAREMKERQNAPLAKANDNERPVTQRPQVDRLFSLTFESRKQAVDFLQKVRDLHQYRLVLTGERTLEVWPRQTAGSNLSRFLELLQAYVGY